MKTAILENINNPKELERLFRSDEAAFRHEFNALYPSIAEKGVADFWNERLNFSEDSEVQSYKSKRDLIMTIAASFLAGFIAKLYVVFNIDWDNYYMRNIGFIVIPILMMYFIWKTKPELKKIIFIIFAVLGSVIFINLYPAKETSDTLLLSCIHLPLFLWSLLGFTYVGGNLKNYPERIGFLRFNGDLVVMTTIIIISGVIFRGITMTLVSYLKISMEFYQENVIVFGASAAPIVATYVITKNPAIVKKVSPVMARIFSPIVLITLIIYLAAIIITGKDPYNDRQFLLTFNFLLIGVLAIILFFVTGIVNKSESKSDKIILLSLSVITIIVNCVALSAIVFRISEWGITPNRLAVLGSNILILINLILVSVKLFKCVFGYGNINSVEKIISFYLPVYSLWTMIVTFIFPLVFGFGR